jgi:HAMP domain-containing protein
MEAATHLVVYLFAVIGAIYLGLTAVVVTGDSRRRREQRERLEVQEWQAVVEAMRRTEQQEGDDA